MGLFGSWKRLLNNRRPVDEGSARQLRDEIEVLQTALKRGESEREELQRQVDLHRGTAGGGAAANAALAMRARCAEVIRAAMPDEKSADQTYSRHALFDILDDVAVEVEALAGATRLGAQARFNAGKHVQLTCAARSRPTGC